MRFRVHITDPKTGHQSTSDVECKNATEARNLAAVRYIVTAVECISESPSENVTTDLSEANRVFVQANKNKAIGCIAALGIGAVACTWCIWTFASWSSTWKSADKQESEQPTPPGWDREQLRRDTAEVARDPSKTIFVPLDGSQPRVVPNPDPP